MPLLDMKNEINYQKLIQLCVTSSKQNAKSDKIF